MNVASRQRSIFLVFRGHGQAKQFHRTALAVAQKHAQADSHVLLASRTDSHGFCTDVGARALRRTTTKEELGLSFLPSRPTRRRTRVAPEEVSYSVVIDSCARKGDARGAANWLEEMAGSAFKPNVFAFNAVIASFARKGMPNEAVDWFDRMLAEGLEPNVVSYTAVIDAFAKAGDAASAVKWYNEMLDRGVSPNTLTYNVLINACARQGDVSGALKWLKEMQSPDAISYSSAIHSCANAWPVAADEAESLFREMHAIGLQPTISTFTALERAVGARKSSAICSSLHIDPRKWRSKQAPPQHRHVRPLARDHDSGRPTEVLGGA